YWFISRRNESAAPDYSKEQDIRSMTRTPISDSDRAAEAVLAQMRADPASGVSCPGALPGASVGNVAAVVGQYQNQGRSLVAGVDV
ncbi:hypothetical protein, partial [Stenotrophomonas sp. SrG]|uniref:hypothetical protein n=1 Tax=Stenotrophomonas sp. SrG TaxID=3414430 RepID=UPI003CF362F1